MILSDPCVYNLSQFFAGYYVCYLLFRHVVVLCVAIALIDRVCVLERLGDRTVCYGNDVRAGV